MNIRSLETIDDKIVAKSQSNSSAKFEVLKSGLSRSGNGSDFGGATGLFGPGLDNMEREYLAGLKGEKDNSVIS